MDSAEGPPVPKVKYGHAHDLLVGGSISMEADKSLLFLLPVPDSTPIWLRRVDRSVAQFTRMGEPRSSLKHARNPYQAQQLTQ
jgi:hypothetical protein